MKFSMHPAVSGDICLPLNLDFNAGFERQVREYFETVPDLGRYESHALPGQAVASILALPVLEMSVGFPHTPIYDIGVKEVVGVLDLGRFRHQEVRPRRAELPRGEPYHGYTVVDGSGRGLTDLQRYELAEVLGTGIDEIREVSAPLGQMDFADPTAGVVDTLLATGLFFEDWTSGRVVFLPPGMGLGAVIQATAIYGLSESWPRVIRLNRRSDGQFHIEELVDPQSLRQFGVRLADRWREAKPSVTLSGDVPEEFREELAALAERHGVEVRGSSR